MPEAEIIPAHILRRVAGHLDQKNFGTGTSVAVQAQEFYSLARRVMLENHYWSFAEKQAVLDPLMDASGTPVSAPFGNFTLFQLPQDFISLTYVNNSGQFRVQNLKYQKFTNGRIGVNSPKLYLSYTSNVTDAELFSPVFEYTLGLFIAQNLCFEITKNTEREVFLLRTFNRQKMESIDIEHRNVPLETLQGTDYSDSRLLNGQYGDPAPNLDLTNEQTPI